jgi:hypothetical protein
MTSKSSGSVIPKRKWHARVKSFLAKSSVGYTMVWIYTNFPQHVIFAGISAVFVSAAIAAFHFGTSRPSWDLEIGNEILEEQLKHMKAIEARREKPRMFE